MEPAVGSTVQRAGKSAVPALTEVSEPDLPAAAAGGKHLLSTSPAILLCPRISTVSFVPVPHLPEAGRWR